MLAKIGIHIEIPALNLGLIKAGRRQGESSEEIKVRVDHIRAQKKMVTINTFGIDKEATELLKLAILELGISPKSHDKIVKVAETIASMDGKGTIESHHLSEAISYRSLDRNLWG
jgi:magnesium chelatase family protein